MKLDEIALLLGASVASRIPIDDLSYDSRRVSPGTLFFCIRGARHDGAEFASKAVGAGAVALVCERRLDLKVPEILVESALTAMNHTAAPFFGNPSHEMKLVGVTGTKGKTTICFMLRAIFEAASKRSGVIGTIEVAFDGPIMRTFEPGVRTTPLSIDLQRLLRRMVDSRVEFCAMEATSIGIHQGRLEGTEFDLAVFTNLSRDHLDEYHGTMESYYESKRMLFVGGQVEQALVDVDDEWGRRLQQQIGIECHTFGIETEADLRGIDIRPHEQGSRLRARGMGLDIDISTQLPGRVNVANALGAVGAAHLLGIDPDAIVRGVESLRTVPGRFERIEEGQDFTVMVDYAHTPASLHQALAAARDQIYVKGGQVVVVFGCGGDRDRTKRPMMGEVAAEGADAVVVTSDNPRSEDPLEILQQIEKGIVASPPPGGYRLVPDRAEAIEVAIRSAKTGDLVLIAGKGHETHQEFADRVIVFDDRDVARRVLRSLR